MGGHISVIQSLVDDSTPRRSVPALMFLINKCSWSEYLCLNPSTGTGQIKWQSVARNKPMVLENKGMYNALQGFFQQLCQRKSVMGHFFLLQSEQLCQ